MSENEVFVDFVTIEGEETARNISERPSIV
jgi:hypothetical protein